MPPSAIAVLLAVYEPRVDWLARLLDSLNTQSLSPACLYVCDDASPRFSKEELEALLQKHITAFPYVLLQNEENKGSNATFAALLQRAKEPYVAFCDQDDVWLRDKLKDSLALLQSSPLRPTLVFGNACVIDGEGSLLARRIEDLRPRHRLQRGYGLADALIRRNFVMGCTLLIERRRALSYLPFPRALVHDHYLAFRASLDGALDFLDAPQLLYRIHGENQTGTLAGVQSRADYVRLRIRVFCERIRVFSRYTDSPALREAAAWSEARLANAIGKRGGARRLLRLWHCDPTVTAFELLALRLPSPLFRLLIRTIARRRP